MKAHLLSILLLLFLLCNQSISQLTVQAEGYGSKSGFIDQATIVVEPHGAFIEQSLYLHYSDHNQYPSQKLVEIVHRFQLPSGAVINNMWLWMGDSAVKAIMLDTWTARHIYDSVVSKKRDPAFLSKNGNIYELHIYPLESGSYRKLRLNFIVPTRWFGNKGVAELPLRMLKDDNNNVKPLQVIFRDVENKSGIPRIIELPQIEFDLFQDTSEFPGRRAVVTDITGLASFSLEYKTSFSDGVFFGTSDVKNDSTYFQFGFNPGEFFDLSIDSTAKKILVGLDLSGTHNKKFSTLLPNIKGLLKSATKLSDSLEILVTGSGKTELISKGWKGTHPDTIDALLDRFESSNFGKEIAQQKVSHILYADADASICWQFPGLEDLATFTNYNDIVKALQDSEQADIIAAYDHGFEQAGNTQNNFSFIISKLDSFFMRGGRLLSYYDFNRVGSEKIGSYYVKGLTTSRRADGSTTLYRNTTGNIGMYFPENFVHYGFDFLQYDPDTNVKIEVQDIEGKPIVISKKVGNGLLVISGIWSFRDDGALRGLLGVPLLGLNEVTESQQLTEILNEIQTRHLESGFDRVVLMSNSDTLFQRTDAENWKGTYLSGFAGKYPSFTTINLLDGSGFLPQYVTDKQIRYYGSGYLLKTISQATNGSHFETHSDNWNYIGSALSPYSYPRAESLGVVPLVNDGGGQLKELREVNSLPNDPNKARFYIGATSFANKIQFNLSAKFVGIAEVKNVQKSFSLNHDTTKMEALIPAMLGYEKLKDLFNAGGTDTAAIVKLSLHHNLLTDYSALIALEPKDTAYVVPDPDDPNNPGAAAVQQLIDEIFPDSLTVIAFPNPFNNQTNIVINTKSPSRVSIDVYNILGQLVMELVKQDIVTGKKIYPWKGTDSHNNVLSSGVYFIRAVSRDQKNSVQTVRLMKILLMK